MECHREKGKWRNSYGLICSTHLRRHQPAKFPVSNYTTLYIRHILEIPDLTSHQRVILSVKSDDGFVAYVNAREVGRIRIPEAADKKTLPHNATANNAFEPLKPDEIDVTKYLKSGKNILALHGVNRALQSSDFSLIPVIRAENRPVINKGKKVRAERNF